ncbi:MAG: hypothetical protein ACYS1A_03035 [Planctomycetota bacterium]|jgi:hypothetical protein
MALTSDGIERVRVFELPGGIWANGNSVAAPRIALVKWRSTWNDKFYQIYINGQYAGTTLEAEQRQIIVQMSTSFETPVRVEVFAVEPEEGDIDFSDEIESSTGQNGRVKISLLRGQNLPIGSSLQIYFDNGTGEIDYSHPLNDIPIRIWPNWQDKAGFGMSRFSFSDFGYDSAAAVGFGKGNFGQGQFGLDADAIEWISEQMEAGVYKFAVKVVDGTGNENNSETGEITVIPAARPVEQLGISSFDKQTNQLVLNMS